MTDAMDTAYGRVLNDIAMACAQAQRTVDSVKLLAVSKTQSSEAIVPVLLAGQRVFGENRVQEAKQKWPNLRAEFKNIELHLIGPLQSNKVADAVALFDVIQTVDREKLLVALATEMKRQSRQPQLLVQVNTGRETQKAGIAPENLAAFLTLARDKYGIKFSGLMCIPPVAADPVPHFRMLSNLAATHGLRQLSMGMSSDFVAAIAEGATCVRVGTAIFGTRAVANPPVAK